MKLLLINFNPYDGETVMDGFVNKYIDEIVSYDKEIEELWIGSELLLLAFRLAVKEGKITCPVEVIFPNEERTKIGSDGNYEAEISEYGNEYLKILSNFR